MYTISWGKKHMNGNIFPKFEIYEYGVENIEISLTNLIT